MPTGRVEVIGPGTDPVATLPLIERDRLDLLFLDIKERLGITTS